MKNGRSRRLWVVTECYPRPGTLTHCIFAHRQLVGVAAAGWSVSVLRPNGWFPPALWRVAPAWRAARALSVPPAFELDGISVRDLPHRNRVPGRLNLTRDVAVLIEAALDEELRRVAANAARDVIGVQFALPYGPLVRRSARRRHLHYTVHLRGDDVWIWPHASAQSMQLFCETLMEASAIFGVSESILAEARRLCGAALRQGVVIPNGIDLELFRPPGHEERAAARAELGVTEHDLAVVCVATAIARKGWRELLAALQQGIGARAVVLAASTGAPDLDLETERSRLAPNVRLIARRDLDARSLLRLYHAADVFCLPSHGEGLSNSLLEAMACGVPVVTTPVGGHREVVTPGVEGLLVPVRDVASLAAALARLPEDAAARIAMGAAGRRRAEGVGTPKANGARVAAVLDSLIASPVSGFPADARDVAAEATS